MKTSNEKPAIIKQRNCHLHPMLHSHNILASSTCKNTHSHFLGFLQQVYSGKEEISIKAKYFVNNITVVIKQYWKATFSVTVVHASLPYYNISPIQVP